MKQTRQEEDDPRNQHKNPLEGTNPANRNFQRPNEDNSGINDVNNQNEIEDSDSTLTGEDMEENNLSMEEANRGRWDEPDTDK